MSAWFMFRRLCKRVENADVSPEELVETLETHPDVKRLWEMSRMRAMKKWKAK